MNYFKTFILFLALVSYTCAADLSLEALSPSKPTLLQQVGGFLGIGASRNYLRHLRESPAIKRTVIGALHFGTGLTGILCLNDRFQKDPTQFYDHPYLSTAVYSYLTSHCFRGTRILLQPLTDLHIPIVSRLFHTTSQTYGGIVNTTAALGVIGFCRDVNSIAGHGVGVILAVRGCRHFLLAFTGQDVLVNQLEKHLNKQFIAWLLLLTPDHSPLGRIIDGFTETVAALTSCHALWLFEHTEFMDTYAGIAKISSAPDKRADYFQEHQNDPYVTKRVNAAPFHQRDAIRKTVLDREFAASTERALAKSAANEQRLSLTSRHACLQRDGRTLCALRGKASLLAAPPASTVEFIKGYQKALDSPNKDVDLPRFFRENGGYFCTNAGLERCANPTLYIKNPPHILSLMPNGQSRYTPLLVKEVGWFSHQYRYVVDMFFFPWLMDEFFTISGFSRLIFSHGVTEVVGGTKDIFLITWKILQVLKLQRALQNAAEPSIPQVKVSKIKAQPVASTSLPDALEKVLDPQTQQLRRHQLKEVISELRALNVLVEERRNEVQVKLPGHTFVIQHPKTAQYVRRTQIHDLRNLMTIIKEISTQPVFQ